MTRKQLPNLATRAIRYSRAVRRWIAAGRPERSEEEVRRIHETYCEPCEQFDETRQACVICGCRVRRRGVTLLNKIRMATESCPLGKW